MVTAVQLFEQCHGWRDTCDIFFIRKNEFNNIEYLRDVIFVFSFGIHLSLQT